jgi:hypothetical protein
MIEVSYDPILGCTGWDFEEIQTPSYSEDKDSWVYLAVGKQKLRKYIVEQSRNLSKLSSVPFYKCRRILVSAYDIGGLSEVNRIYIRILHDTLKNLEN